MKSIFFAAVVAVAMISNTAEAFMKKALLLKVQEKRWRETCTCLNSTAMVIGRRQWL